MIDLYTAAAPNARRATLIIEELELPYRIHNLNLGAGEHRRPDYLQINPLGEVPVIIDPDGPNGAPLTLAQSGAIAIYLAEKTGRLLPREPRKRIETLQQLLHVLSDVAATSTAIFTVKDAGGTAGLSDFTARLSAHLAVIDRRLAEREYIAGDLSVADFALYPVSVLPHVASAITNDHLAALTRWKNAMAKRPSVIRGMASSPSGH